MIARLFQRWLCPGWRRVCGWPQRLLILLVQGYRLIVSPWVGSVCRFTPSCSAYSLQALQQHGAAAGSYLTLRRLARCQPLCAGGHDPVPAAVPALFTRFTVPTSACGGPSTPFSRFTFRKKTRT